MRVSELSLPSHLCNKMLSRILYNRGQLSLTLNANDQNIPSKSTLDKSSVGCMPMFKCLIKISNSSFNSFTSLAQRAWQSDSFCKRRLTSFSNKFVKDCCNSLILACAIVSSQNHLPPSPWITEHPVAYSHCQVPMMCFYN